MFILFILGGGGGISFKVFATLFDELIWIHISTVLKPLGYLIPECVRSAFHPGKKKNGNTALTKLIIKDAILDKCQMYN